MSAGRMILQPSLRSALSKFSNGSSLPKEPITVPATFGVAPTVGVGTSGLTFTLTPQASNTIATEPIYGSRNTRFKGTSLQSRQPRRRHAHNDYLLHKSEPESIWWRGESAIQQA